MARDERKPKAEAAPPESLANPQISLVGRIDEGAVNAFLDQVAKAEPGDGDLAMELTTLGGDADLARRIVLEIDLARQRLEGRRFLFLGKTVVYSAGATIMSAFPREDRWLTRDAMLLIHCRQLEKTVAISGPIRASLPEVHALCAQMECGLKLEEEGFRRLVEGSDVGMDELQEKALYNWYLTAEQALERGLVAGLV